MTLPQILKKVRLDREFSQENIAEEIKVDATTYGRYEKGESQIKFEQVAQIAAFYKLTLDEFYHYGDPQYVVSEPNMSNLKKAKVSVIVELDGLSNTLDNWIEKLKKLNSVI